MLSENAVQVKGIIFISKIFGEQYVRSHRFSYCSSICFDYSNEEAAYFTGFEGEKKENKWTVYASVAVNKTTGAVRFLDYRLPSGERMKDPINPVVYS